MKLPHNAINPRIVLGFDNEIKLMVLQTNTEKWTKEDFVYLEQCKIEYLEEKLGYKIKKMSSTVSHDDYEEELKRSTDFYTKDGGPKS